MGTTTTSPSITFYALGTDNIVRIYDENFSSECLKSIKNRVLEIDDAFSVFKEYSEFSDINKNAGKAPVSVSDEVLYVVKAGLQYSKETSGAFNMLTGPLIKLWQSAKKSNHIPDLEKIEAALWLSDYSKLDVNESERTVFLGLEGQSIDGGSIVKGFAADEVVKILNNSDVTSSIIDLGGNIYALGKKSDDSLWKIGIQNPLATRGNIMGAVYAADKAIVTSGNYERFFVADGKKYHHIIDAKTGYPSENGIISVTVVSSNSMAADALSTCAYNLGIDEGFDYIEAKNDAEAIFITDDRRVYVTSGLKENFKLIDDNFLYINKF